MSARMPPHRAPSPAIRAGALICLGLVLGATLHGVARVVAYLIWSVS